MKEDIDAYHKYLNREPAEDLDPEVLDFLDKMEYLQIPSGRRGKEDIWAQIDEATDEEDASRGKSGRILPYIPWLGIAAALALFFLFGPWKSADSVEGTVAEVTSKASETKPIVLPDSSVVTINALSKISYHFADERNVELDGEAFFEVTKGDRFVVNTALGTVEVLGTSFNVFSRDEHFHVSCKTGRVRVEIPSKGFDQILRPGEQVRLDRDTVLYTQVVEEFVGRWQTGEFYFDKRPVQEVLDEISRQYDISINYDSLEIRTFTGYFIKEDIELALTMVCEPLDLTYEIDPSGGVVVKSR